MNWTVGFSQAAETDLAEAIDWYEQRSEGLGAGFLAEVTAIRRRLAVNPFQFPALSRDARRASLRRFPYTMIFKTRDDEVQVVAVFHTSRNPRHWRSRIR